MLTEKEILKKLVSFDTQNNDDITKISDTSPALEFIANYLNDAGIEVSFQEYTIEKGEHKLKRKNLLANLKNVQDNLPIVGLEGHIDTVPFKNDIVPSESYGENPLGEEKNGRIYGRGVVDMKGSLACMIKTISEFQGKYNPQLIITSDEEANKFAGIKEYLKNEPKLDFAICGEPSNFIIKDRFKGALYIIIDIEGKSGHGARQYEGENAIVKGFPVFERLVKLYNEIPNITNPEFMSENEYSHRSSMNLGTLNAGTKVNVIPGHMKIEFEMRLVKPSKTYLNLIDIYLKPFDGLIKKTKVFAEDPIKLTKMIPGAEKLSHKRGVMTGFAEANLMNVKGILTIGYGVGEEKLSHSKEEYVDIKDLEKYTKKLQHFL